MAKRFNTTGVCVPKNNYMANIDNKLEKIEKLIENNNYFTINKPRQYGKTTTLFLLNKRLQNKYLVIKISFEGIGDYIFTNEKVFSEEILGVFADSLEIRNIEKSKKLRELGKGLISLKDVSKAISKFIINCDKEVILIIDEVDKSSNNQLFLSFLGILRNKFLLAKEDEDTTFKSVILAGLYDIKNLKLKLRSKDEEKYNSPWNIAVNFKVDMSLNITEIESMLVEYSKCNNLDMDTNNLALRLEYYTSGYPFLVSRLCQIVDEETYIDNKECWNIEDVDKAAKYILTEENTLFDSLIKNLENNQELYNYIKDIIIGGAIKSFNIDNPLVKLGMDYGYFKNDDGKVQISNQIFLERLYNYMVSKMENNTSNMEKYNFKNNFLIEDGGLDISMVIRKFQKYMKENYSSVDETFIEREGRLIFLAFITPIINGVGFALKEVQISEEKRLDIVITYNSFKYIIELKLWRGESYHEKGIKQLDDYLDIHDMNKGYLVIFNFNKSKEYKEEIIEINNKKILAVYV
ncbi:MAG: AAA family ATPase [Clostridium sp.]